MQHYMLLKAQQDGCAHDACVFAGLDAALQGQMQAGGAEHTLEPLQQRDLHAELHSPGRLGV